VQFQTYTVETSNNILEVHALCGLVGKKAQLDKGGGRILLGNNIGCGTS
jgi:hypothetical protein